MDRGVNFLGELYNPLIFTVLRAAQMAHMIQCFKNCFG
jgi:hypothetical protein